MPTFAALPITMFHSILVPLLSVLQVLLSVLVSIGHILIGWLAEVPHLLVMSFQWIGHWLAVFGGAVWGFLPLFFHWFWHLVVIAFGAIPGVIPIFLNYVIRPLTRPLVRWVVKPLVVAIAGYAVWAKLRRRFRCRVEAARRAFADLPPVRKWNGLSKVWKGTLITLLVIGAAGTVLWIRCF